ncbi:MAG: circadian clock protein KaiC [Burkholderiales bacterium]|nr:circadian clock protein KaiC [Burkholderiales bacterium]
MKAKRSSAPSSIQKSRSGIVGFDEMTGGGLPRGRTTLVVGGAGSGKTIFALQCLAHGARSEKEPGIFVAFEEASGRIRANLEGFDWQLGQLGPKKIAFIDAQPDPDLVQSGGFDLAGLLAMLEAQAKAIGARRIVFDALDILLTLLPDAFAQRREVYRLNRWLLDNGFTAVITAKAGDRPNSTDNPQPFGFMQFMVDCVVILNHGVVQGVSQRSMRVQKYRGSAFDENESPLVIGPSGVEVAIARALGSADAAVSTDRVTSGVDRLDTMLGGGYFRAASVLITGFPGTAKTTLAGAFAEAACKRGEKTLFVSFDSDAVEVIRNLSSVGIKLAPHVRNGSLCMISARTITGSAEHILARIRRLSREHHARCVVVDPVSVLAQAGNELTAHGVAERLVDWSKSEGITLVCTSLLDEISSQLEGGSGTKISALADTWIHLNYLVQAGERNRGMSIIKSRGTAHSNQVRELILSNSGVTLADIYSAGGEVLMGTMRWEKESSERVTGEVAEVARQLKRVTLDAQEAELVVRMKSLQTELIAKQVEKTLLTRATEGRKKDASRGHTRMRELRGADAASLPRKEVK